MVKTNYDVESEIFFETNSDIHLFHIFLEELGILQIGKPVLSALNKLLESGRHYQM